MGVPFGRYELLKRIAAGGMGEIFLARQAGLEGFEKLLVVKVLLPHLVEDEEFITMFLDEARIAARLTHPNVGQIFDLGEQEGAYYIAMEYIHGEDVVRIWKSARAKNIEVPVHLAVRIAADAAAGLDYAHKATGSDGKPLGLVHRDVSPQNILITFDGGVKLIDFGVAKAAGRSSKTATGTLKGKYSYMSPEQADGKEIDCRSDVFALGVVLYEMATSLRLFKRDTEVSTLKAVAECQVPSPSERNPEVDPGLEKVILKALSKDRETRFKDAGEMRLALEDWLTEARKPGSAAHLAAFMKSLYSDRLAKEAADGQPFTEFEGTPSSVFRKSVVDRVTAASRRGTEPAKPKSRTGLFAGVGIGVAALLGVAAVLLWPKPPAPTNPGNPGAEVRPTLTVRTRPAGAAAVLDGLKIGVTPVEGHPLTAGRVSQLEISLTGYKVARREILGAGAQSLDVALEAEGPAPVEEVTLSFVSEPPGATVQLGEKVLGTTPFAWKQAKSVAEVSFQFRRAGFRPTSKAVTPSSDSEVKVALARAPGPGPGPKRTKEDSLDIKTGR